MRARLTLVLALLAGLPRIAVAQEVNGGGVDAGAVSLHSVGVTFPTSAGVFPPGEGADLVATTCTACHSPGMILTQPKLSPAGWTGEVQKMQHVYKATVPDADVPAIVGYLSTLPRPGQGVDTP